MDKLSSISQLQIGQVIFNEPLRQQELFFIEQIEKEHIVLKRVSVIGKGEEIISSLVVLSKEKMFEENNWFTRKAT